MSKRTTMVTYRASPAHVAALKRLTAQDGMSQADLLHKLVDKEMKRRAQAMRKVQRLGQEIEQVPHSAKRPTRQGTGG